MKYNFEYKLKEGQAAEKITRDAFDRYLSNYPDTTYRILDGDDGEQIVEYYKSIGKEADKYSWHFPDIKIERGDEVFSLEIKRDIESKRTGNLCVEYRLNDVLNSSHGRCYVVYFIERNKEIKIFDIEYLLKQIDNFKGMDNWRAPFKACGNDEKGQPNMCYIIPLSLVDEWLQDENDKFKDVISIMEEEYKKI